MWAHQGPGFVVPLEFPRGARPKSPPPHLQVKLEESESKSNAEPSPFELDLDLALTPPPAVRRQTDGGRCPRIRAPSPVSVDDPRVLLPPRQRRQRQQETRNVPPGQLSQRALQQALLRGEVPMGVGADESERGRRRQQPRRQRRDVAAGGAVAHRSPPEHLLLQQALLRGEVPLGVDADASERGRRQERQRRGANVLGCGPPSGRMQAAAQILAALLADYPAPGGLATTTTATTTATLVSGE